MLRLCRAPDDGLAAAAVLLSSVRARPRSPTPEPSQFTGTPERVRHDSRNCRRSPHFEGREPPTLPTSRRAECAPNALRRRLCSSRPPDVPTSDLQALSCASPSLLLHMTSFGRHARRSETRCAPPVSGPACGATDAPIDRGPRVPDASRERQRAARPPIAVRFSRGETDGEMPAGRVRGRAWPGVVGHLRRGPDSLSRATSELAI